MRERLRKPMIMKAFMVLLFALTLALAFPTQKGHAAAATAATMEISGGTTFYEGEILFIKIYDITASGDFSLQIDSTVLFNSTAAATGDTDLWYQWEAARPTTGDIRTLAVYDSSVNVLATKDIFVYEADSALPDDLITTLGVAIFGIMIIVVIVTGMLYRQRG
jgi:hypothetical protein